MTPKIIFRDLNPAVVAAIQAVFPEWDVACSSIWDAPPADIVVSPANCTGRMDGGIDQVYIDRFGWQLEMRLMRDIRIHYSGVLPIGKAHLITTYDPSLPLLICAPTMPWPPCDVASTQNAYLAFMGALECAMTEGVKAISRAPVVLLPGLATATGGMPAPVFAAQMKAAWDQFFV